MTPEILSQFITTLGVFSVGIIIGFIITYLTRKNIPPIIHVVKIPEVVVIPYGRHKDDVQTTH